jgi:metal-dependent amidase/aminoacylase/carboxypeptidase family protein
MLHKDLLDEARALQGEIVALRRAIHAEPELGLQTPKTRDKVRTALADLPLDWIEGPATTGMVATLKGGAGPGRCVLLRGDMDALPMPEETGLDYASTVPGTMHACGHDTHTAMLAAPCGCSRPARNACGRSPVHVPAGRGRFPRRAVHAWKTGCSAVREPDALPEAAFALHVMPNAQHGLVAGRAGAADGRGRSVRYHGHRARRPCRDAAPRRSIRCRSRARSSLAMQTMVARQFDAHDPVIATVARIEGGTAHNVIADFATCGAPCGRCRPGIAPNCTPRLSSLLWALPPPTVPAPASRSPPGFPVTHCDPRAVTLGEAVTHDLFGKAAFRRLDAPIMGAEDFSYVLEQVPGAMFFLGVAPKEPIGIPARRSILPA